MGRQGVPKTLKVIILSTLGIFALLVVIGTLRNMLSIGAVVTENVAVELAYPMEWLVIAVNLSVLVNIVLHHRLFPHGKDVDEAVRTGGFVTAAYLALLIGRPQELLLIGLASLVTYVFVVHFLMKHFILFGRVKLGAMFIAGFVITALMEALMTAFFPAMQVGSAFNAIVPTIVALLANDAQRQGIRRTALGSGVATLGVYAAMSLLMLVMRLG
jgi:Capsule biosynthesis CapC